MKVIQIDQRHLTCECWSIQFHGLAACENCPYKNTRKCGGRGIVLSGKNKRGFKVPLIKKA